MLMKLAEPPADGSPHESTLRDTQSGSHISSLNALGGSRQKVAIIDSRVLIRECLGRSLETFLGSGAIATFASLAEFVADEETCQSASVILLCLDGRRSVGEQLKQAGEERSEIAENVKLPPVVYLCECEDISDIVYALESGAKGYIPTSVTLEVATEALKLVNAGGQFIPASSLMLAHDALKSSKGRAKSPLTEIFTERQAAVVEAVRQGKANKTIAYELKMHESTVKVHVRNIMKKLNARNRTQVAFLTEQLFRTSDESPAPSPAKDKALRHEKS